MRSGPMMWHGSAPAAVVTLLVTSLWLGLLYTGIGGQFWLFVLMMGYGLVPLIVYLTTNEPTPWWEEAMPYEQTDTRERVGSRDSTKDALETLRERYAAGELTDEQFERKLKRLLETETVEDAAERER